MGVFFGLLFPLSLYIKNSAYYNINPSDYTITFSDKDFSSSHITHNHIAKEIFSTTGYKFFRIDSIDSGGAFSWRLDNNEKSYLRISFLLLVVSIFILLFSSSHTIPLFISQTISALIIIKNSIDGGVLNYELGSALILFGYLMNTHYQPIRKALIGGGVLFSIIGISISLYNNNIVYIYYFIITFISLSLLIITGNVYIHSKKKSIIILLICILFSLALIRSKGTVEYAFTHINTDVMATLPCDRFVKRDSVIGKINTICFGKLYNSSNKITLYDTTQKKDIPISYNPIKIAWKDCIPRSVENYTLKIVTPQSINSQSIATSSFSTLLLNDIQKRNNIYEGIIIFQVNSCASLHENIIQESLRTLGITQAIITPLTGSTQKSD